MSHYTFLWTLSKAYKWFLLIGAFLFVCSFVCLFIFVYLFICLFVCMFCFVFCFSIIHYGNYRPKWFCLMFKTYINADIYTPNFQLHVECATSIICILRLLPYYSYKYLFWCNHESRWNHVYIFSYMYGIFEFWILNFSIRFMKSISTSIWLK